MPCIMLSSVWSTNAFMMQGELIVEVLSGATDRPSVSLRPGEPLEPLSLGRNAFWQILADGVSSVQAFIYFDGDAVFVASADLENPAVAAGAIVGADWTEIFAPCEIRLGHAVLVLRDANQTAKVDFAYHHLSASDVERPAEMDFDEGEFSTARVDGRHLEAEHRKRKPRISVPEDDEPTRMADPSNAPPVAPRRSRRKPKIRVPTAEEATRFRPLEDPATTPWRESELEQPATRPVAMHQVPTEPGPFPAVVHPLIQGMQQPMAGPAPAQAQPLRPSAPGYLPPGVGQPQAWSGPPQAPMGAAQPAPLPGQPPAVGPLQANPPAAASAGETTRTAAQGGAAGKNAALARVAEMWKQASFPQKAILCLLPIAFVAVFVTFGDDEPDAPRKKPKPQTSAVASGSAAPVSSALVVASSTAAVETAAPPASVAPSSSQKTAAAPTAAVAATDKGPHPTSGKGAPARTLERQASDAVAAGSNAEALNVYEQLAAQHPDLPVYKEAVRILKGKMAERAP